MDSGQTYPTDDSMTPPPPSSTPSGDQPTQDPIGPNTRRFLYDTISPGESSGRYDIIYGGASGPKFFSDYANHPQQRSDVPGTGLTSDAAGRYQFLSSTWRPIAAKLGLTSFSPENQDRGAAYLASTTYKQATGRDLETDLADPSRRSSIIAALTPQWPSLGKGGGGGGGQTQVAQKPTAPQSGIPEYLKLMMQMMLAQRQTPRVAPADPMLGKLALLNSLMPQQKPVAYTGGGSSAQFPWVNALLANNTPSPAQTMLNARRLQSLNNGTDTSLV